jgi:two-component system sensor histidine kinase RegB
MATLTAAKTNLQRLALMRLVIVCALAVALLYAAGWLRAELAWLPLLAVVLALTGAAIFTFWRLGRAWPATDTELFAQLLFDMLALGALLYFTGGATNPFISYLLVPLSIAAAILPGRYTVALALTGVGIYSVLLFWFQPLALFQLDAGTLSAGTISPEMQAHIAMGHMPAPQSANKPTLNAHIFGMWFNFALSSALITYAVARMAATLREQQAELNRRREDALHNEQLLAVATLAAGTAHELGTPLSTMTVLLDDMHSEDAALNDDIALLRQQVQTCRATLKKLVNTAEIHQRQQRETAALTAALQQVLERWQVLRPNASHRLQIDTAGNAPALAWDEVLQQAVINLLNNAADTDSGPVDIHVAWDSETITLRIRDRGPGIALDIVDQLGKPFVTTKGKGQNFGLGLGLFLSHATLERAGGDVRLFNHPQGGTEAVLRLPVAQEAA